MILSPLLMDHSAASKHSFSQGIMYQNMNRQLIENKRRFVKLDLILDAHIDPITQRHMTIRSVQHHNKTQDAIKRILNQTDISMDARSSTEKKRFRLQPREHESPSSLEENNLHFRDMVERRFELSHDVKNQAIEEFMENDGLRCTSKRIKRDDETQDEMRSSEETNKWKFAPYPTQTELEQALNKCRGLSELLAPWDSPNQKPDSSQENELDISSIDDVEQALLRFHVTSDNWIGNEATTLMASNNENDDCLQLSQYFDGDTVSESFGLPVRKDHDQTKCHKALPCDSSSVSSLSFLEPQLHNATPPTLLRVTTSTILEEQELIWKQIKEEHEELDQHQRVNINSYWHHEVTRGHRIRPPLSPQRRCGITSSMPCVMYQADPSGPLTTESKSETESADASIGFTTPNAEQRKTNRIQSDPPYSMLHQFKSYNDHSPIAIVTPSKTDEPFSKSCLGSHSQLSTPPVDTSSIDQCSQYGNIASSG